MHEELHEIRELEAATEQSVNRMTRLLISIRRKRRQIEAATEATADDDEEGHRGKLIIGPWIAAAITGAGVAAEWARSNAKAVGAFSAGAAGGAAAVVLLPQIIGGPGHTDTDSPRPPAAAPPALPAPHPSKRRHPAATTPAPVIQRPASRTSTLITVPSTPTKKLHGVPVKTHPLHPGHPLRPVTGRPFGDKPCRVYLPHLLDRGLLCGRVAH